ncbi:MAG: hypothetical protein JWO38_4307 [Gemmataceae bacterium]|nr:hypothetical protein [Gemmataceae bacterium]
MHVANIRPVWVVIVSVFVATPAVTAADAETRTFAVAVDGKPAGTCRMSLKAEDDGTQTVTTAVDIKIRAAVFKYTYSFRGREVWKGDRLAAVDASCDDDGKKKTVRVTAGEGGLTAVVNGAGRKVQADAITTTGWRLPDPKAREVVLFDAEDGTETTARLEAVGACQVIVNGQVVAGQRYRLTGKGVDSEWWFDATGRPLRQQMISDGHKVVVTLVEIVR